MPKELIFGDVLPFDEDSPARAVIELGWSREASHVQLASKCIHAATHDTWRPESDPQPEPTTYPTADGPMPGPPPLTFYDGFYVELNRSAINDLIRHLRRARDQAFGRDE